MTSAKDIQKLRGFATLEEAEKHKKTVAEALENGEIYGVEIL